MGGQGSGRKPDQFKRLIETLSPIGNAGLPAQETFFLPNVSAVKPEALKTSSVSITSGAPVGSMIMMPRDITPSGYLKCDGTGYSSATYPELANFLYYPSSPPATFYVPQMQDVYPTGAGGIVAIGTVSGMMNPSLTGYLQVQGSMNLPSVATDVNSAFVTVDPPLVGGLTAAADPHTHNGGVISLADADFANVQASGGSMTVSAPWPTYGVIFCIKY